VSAALLCLASALVLWPVATARARLPALLRGPRAARLARDYRDPALGPLPVGMVAGLLVLLVSTPLVAALAGGCAGLGFRSWSVARGARRVQTELGVLAEALGALGAELRAGRPVDAAVGAAARADPEAALGERLVRAVRDPRPADVGLADEVPVALARVSAAVLLSRRTGCSLADVVSAVEDDLRARLRQREELRSATAAPRAGALLLAGLPILGLAMGAGVGADPWGVLTTTGPGQVLLVVGVGLEVAGVVWSGRLVRRALR
jgi:tight adherence protein B